MLLADRSSMLSRQCAPGSRMCIGLVVVGLAGCVESTEDRFNRFKEEADVVCWMHGCWNGNYPSYVGAPVNVSCMNDALASGTRALAMWSDQDSHDHYSGTYVFTVDHEVRVFESHQTYMDPVEYSESPSCKGPFRVGDNL